MMQLKSLSGNYFTRRRLIVSALFILFLFLRLFTGSDEKLFEADNLKYIEAAKTFPNHLLYNNQLYLLHPPLYPYAIYFSSLVFKEYHIGATAISLIASIITFFVLYRFFMLLAQNFNVTFFALLMYTLSVPMVIASNTVLKESFVVMLIFLTLYYFAKAIKENNKVALFLCTLFGVFLAFSADHAVFIFPALALSYLMLNKEKISIKELKFPSAKFIVVPLLIILIAYGSWLSVKYYQYSSYEYYPNGLEGTPLNTQNLNLLKLISPTNFEDWNAPYLEMGFVSFIKKLAFNFGYMLNIQPFSIPLGLNFSTYKYLLKPYHIAYMALIYLPLAIITLAGFASTLSDFIQNRKVQGNTNLYILGLFLIFLFPLTESMTSPRFIYTSYILFFYFFGYGFNLLFLRKNYENYSTKIIFAIAILMLLIIPYWHYNNPYFIFSVKKAVSLQNTAAFINANLENDAGLMAQQGYGVKLKHLTGRRIVGLSPKPERMPELIGYFNVDYIIFGRFYTQNAFLYDVKTIELIKSNPGKFELIASIKEDYSDFFVEGDPARADEVYIYRVKK